MTDTTSDKQKHLCGSSCIISPNFKTKNDFTTNGLSDGSGVLLQHPIQEAIQDTKDSNIPKEKGCTDHQAKLWKGYQKYILEGH